MYILYYKFRASAHSKSRILDFLRIILIEISKQETLFIVLPSNSLTLIIKTAFYVSFHISTTKNIVVYEMIQ